MENSQNLSLSQRQQQTLAPLQLQYVKALEMTAPEFDDEVRRELDDNPALEAVDEDSPAETESFGESAEELQSADYSDPDEMPQYLLEAHNWSADGEMREHVAVSGGESLLESLQRQLNEMRGISDDERRIAGFIIGNIDDNGYLTRSPAALANDISIACNADVTTRQVNKVLKKVQLLDPPGIGAVDLRDTMLIQLRRRNDGSAAFRYAIAIVKDYFDLLSKMHLNRLRSSMWIPRDMLDEAMKIIRTLDPKPGAQVGGGEDARTRHITPDFYVEVDADDNITLSLGGNVPMLRVEESFTVDPEPTAKNGRLTRMEEAARAFVRQKRDEANLFINAARMRRETLRRVMTAIVGIQREFFLTDDPMKLKPMVLKDVSAVTGDDLSVISRATSGKYVATRQGVYPLKYFFNEHRKDGEDSSSYHVMEIIRSMIEKEDKTAPLSDDALADELKKRGFKVARRTVAKYRERLVLPVARLRRRE